jgi:GTP-binding protein HflX
LPPAAAYQDVAARARASLHLRALLSIVRPMPPASAVRTTEGPRPDAVVVGVQLPGVTDQELELSLQELTRLGETLGLRIVGRVTQRRHALATDAVFGTGKLKELAGLTGGTGIVPAYSAPGKKPRAAQADAEPAAEPPPQAAEGEPEQAEPPAPKPTVVLVDHDLSPGQTRNLEKATGAEVLDRSMVILSIFKRHARTREARMQVEIAQLAYLAPRLREAGAGRDRQRGGIGGKGAGETSLELDRRKIRDRIAELRRELELVQREADTRRSRRSDAETLTVALVGYTNAGKSSLMRALTGEEVYVADQLFATLDTTVRVLEPQTHPRILVSDTVGFIKKLPHDLVASFRSTLEEAKGASLLLHVVDAADPGFREQCRVTRQVLDEIGADQSPTLLVLNKADKLPAEQREALAAELPDAFIMSARMPADVQRLHAKIVELFEQTMEDAELVVPYSEPRQVALLHERCRVLQTRYEPEGTYLRVRAPSAVLGALRRELFGASPGSESESESA